MKAHGKRFTIDQFFYILLSVSLLIAISVVSLAPPLFDWIDKWSSDMNNQFKIFLVVVGVIGVASVTWLYRWIKRQ